MLERQVLDIGTGMGGKYLDQYKGRNVKIFCLDQNRRVNKALQQKYPHVVTITGSAENIPFPNEYFHQIQTYFPCGELSRYGLSAHRDGLGWFGEFNRALIKGGVLKIAGDTEGIIDPIKVKEAASLSGFNLVYQRQMSARELQLIATYFAGRNLQEMREFLYNPTRVLLFRKQTSPTLNSG